MTHHHNLYASPLLHPAFPPSSATEPKAPRSFDFAHVDVFAERALEGNALAIFTDVRGLSTQEMQALARETNLSETTFILPRDASIEAARCVQVRIFTVAEELQFAGHPTLGTASWLYWNHPVLRGAETITLDLPVGPIPVRFNPPVAPEQGVYATMRQNNPTFGTLHDRAQVAAILGLSIEDLDNGLLHRSPALARGCRPPSDPAERCLCVPRA